MTVSHIPFVNEIVHLHECGFEPFFGYQQISKISTNSLMIPENLSKRFDKSHVLSVSAWSVSCFNMHITYQVKKLYGANYCIYCNDCY